MGTLYYGNNLDILRNLTIHCEEAVSVPFLLRQQVPGETIIPKISQSVGVTSLCSTPQARAPACWPAENRPNAQTPNPASGCIKTKSHLMLDFASRLRTFHISQTIEQRQNLRKQTTTRIKSYERERGRRATTEHSNRPRRKTIQKACLRNPHFRNRLRIFYGRWRVSRFARCHMWSHGTFED